MTRGIPSFPLIIQRIPGGWSIRITAPGGEIALYYRNEYIDAPITYPTGRTAFFERCTPDKVKAQYNKFIQRNPAYQLRRSHYPNLPYYLAKYGPFTNVHYVPKAPKGETNV